jgi:hypothetical protein
MSYTTEQYTKTLIPSIRWHQTNENVIIFFDVHNVDKNNNKINNKINIETNKIYFNVKSNNNNYYIELDLYDTINVDESIYTIEEKFVKITLQKTNDNNISWNSLLKDKNMYKNNIKVNWQNWEDSDEDEELPNDVGSNKQQYDFHKMMESMGGIGNMGEMMQNANMAEMMKNMNLGNNEEMDNEETNDNEELNNDNIEEYQNNDEESEYCYDCNT